MSDPPRQIPKSEADLSNLTPTESVVDSVCELMPTAYHCAVLQCLKQHYTDVWDWFSSHVRRPDTAEKVRVELLKSAYRLDRDSSDDLYQIVDTVARKMKLRATITLYQGRQAPTLNAAMLSLPDEAHLVLQGSVLETLDATELEALIVHELAHFELNNLDGGCYDIGEQVLQALSANSFSGDTPHERTLRSYRLYTELFCDRRAAQLTGDYAACVRALVKMETGLQKVNAAAYIKQADEVLTAGKQGKVSVESEGLTHPEMYIRAKALHLWQTDPEHVDQLVRPFVEGSLKLQHMDILQQHELCVVTNQFLQAFLSPKWLRTKIMLGYLARFETDNVSRTARTARTTEELRQWISNGDEKLRSYFCYLLLDFVTCDPDLEEGPLAAAYHLSEELDLSAEFQRHCVAELKLGKRALENIFRDAADIVLQAEKELAE